MQHQSLTYRQAFVNHHLAIRVLAPAHVQLPIPTFFARLPIYIWGHKRAQTINDDAETETIIFKGPLIYP